MMPVVDLDGKNRKVTFQTRRIEREYKDFRTSHAQTVL